MKHKEIEIPTMESVEVEMQRVRYNDRYRSILRETIYTLLVVAAVAVLIATLWLPFLRIYGTSMSPTLQDGEIVCCVKGSEFKPGEIVAFYYNNKILVKRVIGTAGDWVNMNLDGDVFVNDVKLEEPYLSEKSLGECDIKFPYQVPESSVFVLGDHRLSSIDSRHTSVGCVSQDQIVGKIIFRIWPLNKIGPF